MGIDEDEKQTAPPPWGWPPRQKENAHGAEEIVYHKATKQNMHTKIRRHEQEKVCHKAGRRATPHGQAARNPGERLEPVRKQAGADLHAGVRAPARGSLLHVAAGVQARRGLPHHAARQPMDVSGVRHRQGPGVDQRGQGQHGREDEAHRRDVPCLKTFYNHIESGDMGVFHGQTPYHPGKRKKPGNPAHEARTVPGRRQIRDRPQAANEAKELGHYEMDTVVSKSGTRGGLLVMLDRCSRRYVIEHLNHINQDEVVRAIRRMKARKALPTVRSVTTDNGCEFLSQERLDRAPRQEVVSEADGLQPANETPDPAARGLDQHNPQGITKRRDCVCLRFTSGQSGLRSFADPSPLQVTSACHCARRWRIHAHKRTRTRTATTPRRPRRNAVCASTGGGGGGDGTVSTASAPAAGAPVVMDGDTARAASRSRSAAASRVSRLMREVTTSGSAFASTISGS